MFRLKINKKSTFSARALYCAFFALAALTIASCIDSSQNPFFILEAQKKFEAGEKTLSLKELTDFDWSEVCFFKEADSAPGSSYDVYSEFLISSGASEGALSKKSYSGIFVFKTLDGYKSYPLNRGYILINGKKHWIFMADNGEPYRKIEKCIKGAVYLKNTKSGYVLIGNEE